MWLGHWLRLECGDWTQREIWLGDTICNVVISKWTHYFFRWRPILAFVAASKWVTAIMQEFWVQEPLHSKTIWHFTLNSSFLTYAYGEEDFTTSRFYNDSCRRNKHDVSWTWQVLFFLALEIKGWMTIQMMFWHVEPLAVTFWRQPMQIRYPSTSTSPYVYCVGNPLPTHT